MARHFAELIENNKEDVDALCNWYKYERRIHEEKREEIAARLNATIFLGYDKDSGYKQLVGEATKIVKDKALWCNWQHSWFWSNYSRFESWWGCQFIMCLLRLVRFRTPGFHPGNMGSNPVGDANLCSNSLTSRIFSFQKMVLVQVQITALVR